MKKLLVLMLVFGLASAANAAISLQIGGSEIGATIDIPQAVTTIQIYSDDSSSWLGYCIIEAGGAGTLSNGAPTANAGDNAYDVWYPDEPEWGLGYVIQSDWLAVQTQAGIQHTIDLDATLLEPGSTGVISLWRDPDYNTAADITTFTVVGIPEPATIALLGLGGLLLRRRK